MRILHITNAYPIKDYSAYGIFISEQIDSLNNLGFVNDVFFINARQFGKMEYIKRLKEIKTMAEDYDLVHCHHLYSATSFLLSGSRKPYIYSLLNDITHRGIIDKIMYFVHNYFSKKIIYKNTRKSVNKKMIHLPNGVNIDFFKPIDKEISKIKSNLDTSKKYILFVSAEGIKNKRKRYDLFLSVVRELKVKGYDLEPLVLSGVNRELVPYYYNSSDLFLLTSNFEGSPNAVKEAMACNLPVVSTDVGNVRDMIEGCEGSFVASSQKTDELVDLCIKSLDSKINTGRNTIIKKELDMKSIALKIKNVYEEILRKK